MLLIGSLCMAGVLCAGIAVYQYLREERAGIEYEKVKEAATQEEQSKASDVVIPVDFETLQQTNPDIYAWIRIPGTDIDYPVVQSPTDNSYYLDHNAEKEESKAGAIFTEDYNSKTFEDPNTVLYGHNMKNGTMFQGLHAYTDRDFFDQNREVLIYMPGAILHYKIFAAYLTDNRHLLQSFDFGNEEIFAAYLTKILDTRDMNAFIDTGMEIDKNDRIITLSTCYAGIDTQRYLVQAVLVSIEQ